MAEHISQKTILLVEDEALIAMNEAAILKKHGYGVITAYNAEKAIEAANHQDIDLVLMDIDLGHGRMDGTEAAEIILREKEIPVVFLSSHTEPEVVEKTEGITSYGYVIEMNKSFLEIFGISDAGEVKNFNLFKDPNLTEEVKEKLSNRENVRYEIAFDFENILYGYLVQVVDINNRKLMENQKDYLMQELNRRVKNNLNMVSSLIKLKNSSRGDDCLSSTKTAVPLGLIINELATNAIKYGFANGREAVYAVDLRTDASENQYVLTVSNTGNPFPADIGLDNPETLGLRLVTALVQQLRGTIELQREPYPVFTIRFPKVAAL